MEGPDYVNKNLFSVGETTVAAEEQNQQFPPQKYPEHKFRLEIDQESPDSRQVECSISHGAGGGGLASMFKCSFNEQKHVGLSPE